MPHSSVQDWRHPARMPEKMSWRQPQPVNEYMWGSRHDALAEEIGLGDASERDKKRRVMILTIEIITL